VFASGLPVSARVGAGPGVAACRGGARPRHEGRARPGLVLLYALGVQMADAHGITTDGVT
jgi:hypothetical protein